MSVRHGIFVSETSQGVASPAVTPSGVPFVVGSAPIQSAEKPATVGMPVVCHSWNEFVEAFGYSDDWAKYDLCEFAYSQFKVYGVSPAIFCNLLDPATMSESVTAADVSVTDHQAKLPIEAIDDTNLIVKASGGAGAAYTKGTDYSVFYSGEYLVVELISTSTHYAEASLNIAYKKVTPASVNATAVAAGFANVERCVSLECVPDLLCSPNYSSTASVAAVMAQKCKGISGCFMAKALVDLPTTAGTTYSAAITAKATNLLTDEDEIVCWAMVSYGGKKFHMSTAVAGLIGATDYANGCPVNSPSNKKLYADAHVLADGSSVVLTKNEADALNAAGIVTMFNFLSVGYVCWGNYTGYHTSTSAANPRKEFIPVGRMFDWVGNTLVRTFWTQLDSPITRRTVDTIVDTANIWLAGIVAAGYLYGARVEMQKDENPLSDLVQGIVRIHIYITPPAPAQEIDFSLEYDSSYLETALS